MEITSSCVDEKNFNFKILIFLTQRTFAIDQDDKTKQSDLPENYLYLQIITHDTSVKFLFTTQEHRIILHRRHALSELSEGGEGE